MKRIGLKDWKSLIDDTIWANDTTDTPKWWRVIVRFVKLVRITFGTFAENRMGFQCVALAYFVALAIVPFTAVVFALSGGLGLKDRIAEILLNAVPNYPELASTITEKAGNIIDIARSGWVGLISALFFVWTILWMMFQVERVFNNVWGIRKIPRKIYKRFGFYFLVIFLSPFLVLTFGTGIALYVNLPAFFGIEISEVRLITKILGWMLFAVIACFTFSVMYKYIPATEVKYKYALKAAVVSAIFFTVFQYLYLETQVFVARLNAVYGVIAALPLFLIWLNFSWQIIIYGAELTYGYQNVDTFNIPEWDDEKNNK